ncbi:MAG: hypothetical protein NTZ53_03445 [Cyanobacteria bacterium]|nr:hypothetical protein [Cyanobacteriota bacterium]
MRTAFGLNWRSPSLELHEFFRPGCTGASTSLGRPGLGFQAGGLRRQPVIDVVEADPAHWPPLPPGAHDTAFVTMGLAELRLNVEGIGQFRVWGGHTIAWSRCHPQVGDQDLRTFLLSSAVGALLIQRGLLVLHGNALVKDGKAIVCLGHSGAGKSTLAYALMRQGWQLLADDLVAITSDGRVLPGIPRIKLWEDAAVAFGLVPSQLQPVRQGLRKYLISGSAIDLAPQPVPLQSIYFIHRQRHGISAGHCAGEANGVGNGVGHGVVHGVGNGQSICLLPSQQQAALRLRNHAFRPRFVRGLGQEGANFIALARLQRSTRLASLAVPLGIPAMARWLETVDLLSAANSAAQGNASSSKVLAEVS